MLPLESVLLQQKSAHTCYQTARLGEHPKSQTHSTAAQSPRGSPTCSAANGGHFRDLLQLRPDVSSADAVQRVSHRNVCCDAADGKGVRLDGCKLGGYPLPKGQNQAHADSATLLSRLAAARERMSDLGGIYVHAQTSLAVRVHCSIGKPRCW